MKKINVKKVLVRGIITCALIGLIWFVCWAIFAPYMTISIVNSTPASLLAINKANVEPAKWNITFTYAIRIVGANFDLKRYRLEYPGDVAYEALPDESRNVFVIMTNNDFRDLLPYIDRFVKAVEYRPQTKAKR
ncbi:MAG: hypothetical protein A2359_04920 [Candidatus Moranbacteria bacterium RIFOXYB1_FULL_43_19]|nr:MAG: hypothetical protein A2359_04920 [Candidatus Moranbacteria bacterium RIFOXYB1_FULL_43_19]OGI28345.1 MAG: hypothetical protein A2184_04185 [Candidatus Moranbacteria bacterium RIFOXYA1_FULL_44_7]OGI33595.1 MAG: hypothetical protein A2420_00550 [Candidatus Moranbacteria bacterium RIFOXYC1_FULL_44_13]OGI37139.1 MAG: hypothetical protein A2612_00080 [Candidatus Moranbacteria bacterium RIFOXYD1_FULL_44_12]